MAADDLCFPSPSVILRASPSPPPALPQSKSKHVQSKTTEAPKKKTARKGSASATAVNGEGGGVSKPKQSKSRNGCVTCKFKRLKCDEAKPGCAQCAKRKVDCGGYKKDFKWRPFGETNVKIDSDRQKQASPPQPVCAESSISMSPITQFPRQSDDRPSRKKRDDKRPSTVDALEPHASPPQRPAKPKRKRRAQVLTNDTAPSHATRSEESLDALNDDDLEDIQGSGFASPLTMQLPLQTSIAPHAGLSPTLTEILQPYADVDVNIDDRDFINFSLPQDVQFPLPTTPVIDPALMENDILEEDMEDTPRADDHVEAMPLYLTSRRQTPTSPHSSRASDDPAFTSWQGPVNYLYSQPNFPQDSKEMLTFRFDRLTCGILSVMDGPSENPWRTLIWPLAQNSPALYHAIIAMTAFHSSADVPRLRIVGHEYKQASIRYIQEGIRDSSMTDQTAIATALALGFSESWDQHTTTGNTHIKGAQALVKRAMASHQLVPLQGVELARLKFLCNAWVYMDVIARLTSVDSDESVDFDNTFLFSADSPSMVNGDGRSPGFGIDFGMPIDARLDPLMGCANTLFPLIGRVANLVRKVCRSHTNSPAVITLANDLKLAIETWDPPAFIERPEDPTTDVQHTLQTAEAYRWATLLHLHQSVPELPSLDSEELARRVLQYLATVPLVSRTVIVQIYPLMVAGCEAKTDEDRQWVRDRWHAMGLRMRIGVIDKCAMVTEEVWRRKEVYEAQPTTMRRLVATADLQPARRRGAPLDRSNARYNAADPGRTGMVFTYVEGDGEGMGLGTSGKERWSSRKNVPDRVMGAMDPAYTVRGHLHWVGVMWDWGWEILLG